MADTPRPWQIMEALQARLRQITVVGGYRTDAGADVRLERSEQTVDAEYITIYSASKVRPDDTRVATEREFTVIVEAVIPAGLFDAHRRVTDVTEDIEDALHAFLPMPNALPLSFREAVYLDAPDGLPVMASQSMFSTRYR